MTKQQQLSIAIIALVGALAVAAIWKPAVAASCTDAVCVLDPKPWKEPRTDNGAQFVADYAKARFECNGDYACMNKKLEDLGWKPEKR